MTRGKTRALTIGAAIAVAAVASIAWFRYGARPATPPPPPTRYDTLPRVLARVGDVEITKEELRKSLATDEVDQPTGDETNDEFYQALTWITARNAVMVRVLMPEVRRRGIALSEEDRRRLTPSAEQRTQLENMATQIGTTATEVLHATEEAFLVEKLLVSELEKEPVDDAEISAEYARTPTDFTLPGGYRIRHVLLAAKPGETEEELAGRAAALWSDLRHGERDFADAARRQSAAQDARSGGLMPEFTLRQPPTDDPEFAATVAALQPGELSRPFRTASGYEILKLESRTPQRLMPLEQVRPQIVRRLQLRKGKLRVRAWVEEQERLAGAQILVPPPPGEGRTP